MRADAVQEDLSKVQSGLHTWGGVGSPQRHGLSCIAPCTPPHPTSATISDTSKVASYSQERSNSVDLGLAMLSRKSCWLWH